MKVIGLTGGVGTGKSTCAEFLRRRGIRLIDTDDLARELVEPGQPALAVIVSAFGSGVMDGSRLNRRALARIVFAEPEARRKLESILHPAIRESWRARVRNWKSEGAALAFVIIPLLFETRAESELDKVVCVACSPVAQAQRLASRGWSEAEIRQRIEAQLPLATKVARADFVIWNDAGLDVHEAQLDRILRSIQSN